MSPLIPRRSPACWRLRLLVVAPVLLSNICHRVAVEATYSIAATDQNTGQVGGVGASCVDVDIFPVIYNAVPGVGVLHAQAALEGNEAPRAVGVELLSNGTDPKDIVASITTKEADPACCFALFFPYRSIRQYGVVDLVGRAAGHTGGSIQRLYTILGWGNTAQKDVQGRWENYTYSVQGNVVTEGVVDEAEKAFTRGDENGRIGCDLADRLMISLEAGGSENRGDFRCTSTEGIASTSSFLHVDDPNGTAIVHLTVVNTEAPQDAVVELRKLYDAWRLDNPCPDGNWTNSSYLETTENSTLKAGNSEGARLSGNEESSASVSLTPHASASLAPILLITTMMLLK